MQKKVVHVVVIAYGLAEDLKKLFASCKSEKYEIVFQLYLHSRYPEVVQVCAELRKEYRVIFEECPINRGLARSWSEGLAVAYLLHDADLVILANDDIVLGDGDFDKFVDFALENQDKYLVSCEGYDIRAGRNDSMNYGFAAITKAAFETIGVFDCNFFPVYFEDCDYNVRARLAGLESAHLGTTQLVHLGSANIYSVPGLMQQNRDTFRANRDYYIKKWGGEPGQEVYTSPFNDPEFDVKIRAALRSNPYFDYDRNDFADLVKI